MQGYWEDHYDEWGVVRPVTTLEVYTINSLCNRVFFGWAILIPLALTIAVSFVLLGLLRDVGLPPPWPWIGAAAWLLAPLATESALWPSVFHVSLGLGLALGSARALRRGGVAVGTLLALASYLCVEQVILVVPFVAWLIAPQEKRRIAAISTGLAAILVLGAYSLWPGSDPGHSFSISERLANLTSKPSFYVSFPGVGLGGHSIPLAVVWALPFSILALAAGAIVGWVGGPALLRGAASKGRSRRPWLLLAALAVVTALMNIPFATGNHEDSPRHFTPTWLALVSFGVILGSQIDWRRHRLVGAMAGLLIVGALLSQSWSSWVRIRTSDIMESTYEDLGNRLPDRAEVAVCGVVRTVVEPAPGGDFAVHDFLGGPGEGFGEEAYLYYTGRIAQFHTAGIFTPTNCPEIEDPDVKIDFDRLVVRD